MTIKELREKRVNLAKQAEAVLQRSIDEKREMTAEEITQFDNFHRDIDSLKAQIDRQERQEDIERELRGSQGTQAGGHQNGGGQGAGGQGRTAEEMAAESRAAYGNWMRFGMAGLSPEHREIMATRQSSLPAEARAMAVGVDTAGGYAVDDGFVPRIETAMLPYAGVRGTRVTIMRTPSGNDIPMPTSNDTSNSGEMLGENTAASEQDITLGSKTLRAYMFSSKLIRVSFQFLQDSSVAGIESWLAERLGERIGRATGTKFVAGTGNNMPEGLESGATLGVTAASQTVVTTDELVDLEHSVNAAYRRQAEWLIADGLVKALKKLKDGDGRTLWSPGLAVREPDTLMGYRYSIDLGIATPATTVKSIYFGDFSKFIIRDVSSMQMLRLTERYAEYLQVAFLLFSRHDSMLLDAGTNPIKYLKQA